ncbi:DUF6252 family protein [Hymenobacter algoricola]|uniref:Lipoprotein n=1 Tax=Hymenobacter algoricola TaxID=486267 RepID=A0ABP7NIK7_9BACT
MKSIFCLLVLLGGLTACKKDAASGLPKATQEGKGTFGCLINNRPFIPSPGGIFSSRPVSIWYWGDNLFLMKVRVCRMTEEGNHSSNDVSFVHLYVSKLLGPGRYPLASTTAVPPYYQNGENYGMYEFRNPSKEYHTNRGPMGWVEITKAGNRQNDIISGTFEFKAFEPGSGEEVNITKGRFDLRNGQ